MRKIRFIPLLFLVFLFSTFSVKSASAASVTLSGHVSDNANTAISGATVTVNDTNNDQTTTDSSGNYSLSISSGTYNVQVTPPTGSNSSSAIALSQNISTSTVLNFVLTPVGTVTLSGHVYDAQGNVLTNQTVYIQPSNGSKVTATTDSSGNYSITTSAGTYQVGVSANNSLSVNAPQYYTIFENNYSLTQSTILDIRLPLKKVSLHIQDASGNPVSSVEIKAANSGGVGGYINNNGLAFGGNLTTGTGSSVYGYNSSLNPIAGATTDSSGNATLYLFPTNFSNTYTFTANPPSGGSYSTTNLANQTITADTNLTITMQQPVTLSGHVHDAQGNVLANQTVYVQPGSGSKITTTTDSSGSYSLQAAPGTYQVGVSANNSLTVSAPQYYTVFASNYSLTQNTVLEITLPLKKVSLHVQDASGNPVSSVEIKAANSGGVGGYINNNGLAFGGSITTGTGSSVYGYNSSGSPITGPTTDSSGNATLYLFPTNFSNTYTFTANPPTGSIYKQFTLSNITVTSDQTEVVSLQYNHATPVTTANLATQYSDGTYSNPTTVTLSATAAASYTVANTYYTVDGGAQQTYSSPFTVSGNGSHTITYWSVDNSGAIETTNTKTFTIAARYNLAGTVYVDANQNGFQDTGEAGYAGATVTLDSGQSTTTDSNGNYSFSSLPAATYTETLTLPNGYSATTTNPANVALSADTTQNFGIAQANSLVTAINAGGSSAGNFAADTNNTGGQTYTSSASVDTSNVNNPAPQAVYQTVRFGNFSYTIPNLTPNGTYTLRLHFNELYWGTDGSDATGKRVFNVGVNGTTALTNYDIYKQAGGANKAVVAQVPATADSNGNVTVQFTTVTDNAMVNGIELYSGTLPSPTPTPTPTPITSEAINTGGTATGSFLADIDSTGGQPYSSTASVDTSSVTNPAPQSVYQTVRYGNFSYNLTNFAPNSNHTVRLHFNELYWGTDGSDATGKRVFNVSINGSQVLSNFDIYQTAGGANKAVVEEFPVTADTNGKITIQFTTVTDNAMVNGIEVN